VKVKGPSMTPGPCFAMPRRARKRWRISRRGGAFSRGRLCVRCDGWCQDALSGGDDVRAGRLLKNNSKPIAASPNDTARSLEFLACNYKNNIFWNSENNIFCNSEVIDNL
jgi:hypothetical protein